MVEGKCGIYAKVLKDSISPDGVRLTTYEAQYPRIIHAEFLTHGMLSKNSASSRAIPFEKMAQQLTGRPVRFGQANSGMQDKGEDYDALINGYTPEEWWRLAQLSALKFSEGFYEAGYHKQVYNRRTEADQMMKTVITGTEFNNFFWLRNHGAADPTLEELARCMFEAREASVPMPLYPGEWSLPYVETDREYASGKLIYWIEGTGEGAGTKYMLSLEDAKKVSAARTAAVSFRNIDYGVEKSREVWGRLVGDDRIHGSATEHQATPMQPVTIPKDDDVPETNIPYFTHTWEAGVSHMDRQAKLWSGKLRGWICLRKLIPGENVPG